MAVIRDVMPAFDLLQPSSAADAQKLLQQTRGRSLGHGWWTRQLRLAQRPHQEAKGAGRPQRHRRAQGNSLHRRRYGDRCHDHAHRNREPSRHQSEVRSALAMLSQSSLLRRFATRAPSAAMFRRTRAAGTTAPVGPATAPAETFAMPTPPSAATASTPSFAPDRCVAVHPSDSAPALIALDAKFVIQTPKGERIVDAEDYFLGPDIDITRLNILQPGDLLTAIRIPSTWAGAKFYFEKVRDRNVWDFPLMNVASAMSCPAAILIASASRSAPSPPSPCASRLLKMRFAASQPTQPPAKWQASSPFRARSRSSSTHTRFR